VQKFIIAGLLGLLTPHCLFPAVKPCARHLLQTAVSVIPFELPLSGNERLICNSQRRIENQLCASVSLANGLARTLGSTALDHLNTVLHVLQKRTRRDSWDLERRGIEAKQLATLIEQTLGRLQVDRYTLQLRGKWSWQGAASNILLKDLQEGTRNRRTFVLAFIKTSRYGYLFKDQEIPTDWREQKEGLAVDALSRDISMIGKNGSGHVVLLDAVFVKKGVWYARYLDPEKRIPQVRSLTPFSSERSGYDSFVLSLGKPRYSPSKTKRGNNRLFVSSFSGQVISSIFIVDLN
jgi:hypothetical protein